MADRESLRRALEDPDEAVRAAAAVELARGGDRDALEALVRTIDDAPSEAHLDETPAAAALAAMGLPAVPALLELLGSEREETRLHAQRALESIVYARHGFASGRGFPSDEAEREAASDLRAAGYDYTLPSADRAAAVERWRAWFERAVERPRD